MFDLYYVVIEETTFEYETCPVIIPEGTLLKLVDEKKKHFEVIDLPDRYKKENPWVLEFMFDILIVFTDQSIDEHGNFKKLKECSRYIVDGDIALINSWIKPPKGTILDAVDLSKNIFSIVSFPASFLEKNPQYKIFLNKEVILNQNSLSKLKVLIP